LTEVNKPDDLACLSNVDDPAAETLLFYVNKIKTAKDQLMLINSIIEGITHFCDRAAFFILLSDKLVGWTGKGFSGRDGQIHDDDLKKLCFSLSANTIFKVVIEQKIKYFGEPLCKPDDFQIYNSFGGSQPKKIFVLPFISNDKLQAVIYADSLVDTPIHSRFIEILVVVGEISLELMHAKNKLMAMIKPRF